MHLIRVPGAIDFHLHESVQYKIYGSEVKEPLAKATTFFKFHEMGKYVH